MDGDVAPLAEIVELAQRHDARVMVDEAHGTGAIGPDGRGAVAAAGLEDEVDLIVGTLGKALGSYGAYVCCDSRMAKYLVNTARTLIFSTAIGPPAVAAAMAALELLREQPRRVEKLQRNGAVLREALIAEGLPLAASETQIVPLVVGDAEEALSLSERVLERGVFAQAIRPPTVPVGGSRLRLTVMASHTKSELRDAAKTIAAVTPSSLRAAMGQGALADGGLGRPGAADHAAGAPQPAGSQHSALGRARAAADATSSPAGSASARRTRIFDRLADAA